MPERRRGNREGTIYPRKDGRWEAAVPQVAGKRKRFYGATRQEVAQKLNHALHDQARGLPLPDDRQTLGRWLTYWLEEAKATVRPGTWRSYERIVRCHLVPELGKVRLMRLEPEHVHAMMGRKLAAGQSAANVAKMRVVLRRALTVAMYHGKVYRNVAAMTQPPKVRRYDPNPLTGEDLGRFLAAIDGDPMEAAYVVELTTGLRVGELLGLQWQDLDLDRGRAYVRRQIQREKARGLVVSDPKTSLSRRVVELRPAAVDALRAHRRAQATARLQLGTGWVGSSLGEFVFTTALGTPVDPSNFTRRSFKPALRRAGLPDRRFHDLRVSFGSLLIEAGEDNLKVISELLGHSTITLTANTYLRVRDLRRTEAAARLDRLFEKTADDGNFDGNRDVGS